MKKLLGCVLAATVVIQLDAGIFDLFGFGASKEAKEQILLTAYDKYKQQQTTLQERIEKLQTADPVLAAVNRKAERLAQIIPALKQQIEQAPLAEQDFLRKKVQIYVDIYQELTNLQLSHQQYLYQLEQTAKAIDLFLQNADFEDIKTPIKSSYQFEEYQEISKQLLSVAEEIEQKKLQRENIGQDIAKLDKQLAAIQGEIKSKEKDQQEFGQSDDALLKGIYDIRSRGELIDLQKELLDTQRQNREMRKMVLLQESELIDFQLFVLKSKLSVLEQNATRVERSLYVNEFDLYKAQNELNQKKTEIQQEQVVNSNKIVQLTAERDALKLQFDELNAKANVPIKDIAQLTDWSIDLATVKAEPAIVQLGTMNDSIIRLGREIALLEAQQELAKIKLQSDELLTTTLQTWYKITQSRFKTEAARSQELATYKTLRDDLERELAVIKSKDNAITNSMSGETRSLATIKRRLQEFAEQKEQLVQQYGEAIYTQNSERLKAVQAGINRQLDLNGQIIKTYSTISSTIKDMLKHIRQVIAKLEKIGGIWQRAPQAVTIQGLAKIGNELVLYWADVMVSITQMKSSTLFFSLRKVINTTANRLPLIILLIVIIIAVLATVIGHRWHHPAPTVLSWLATRWWLWATLLLYFYIRADVLVSIGYAFRILFYLACIPWFCYNWQALVRLLQRRNAELGYPYVSKALSDHLFTLLAIVGHATIVLVLFKHSFVATLYSKSELPPLLAAIHGILIIVCMLLVIHPTTIANWLTPFGVLGGTMGHYMQFYYPLIITCLTVILIIAEPVLGGYGKLVRYTLSSGLFTILLVAALMTLHAVIKRYSIDFFFDASDEPIRERFVYAKTWYGLFVIVVFALLGGLALVVGAFIWGHPIAVDRIVDLANVEIFFFEGLTASGQVQWIPFTIRSLCMVIAFIFGGFVLAWAFQRFVLNRIFDLFLVDSGVQNTVSRISHYCILVTIFFIMLQRVGAGGWIKYCLAAVAFGIAWAVKGPANDFFAYFTILVERSIKIGDYISLEHEQGDVRGVIRKITPRSVVLRKNNSVTIVVPNSNVIASSILNWNYSRGFIGLDDIIFIVPYGTDPEIVRQVVMQVLEQNKAVLKSPAPIIRLKAFVESGLEFQVRGFVSSVQVLNQWEITSDLRFALVAKLMEVGIELAAPLCMVKVLPSRALKQAAEEIVQEDTV